MVQFSRVESVQTNWDMLNGYYQRQMLDTYKQAWQNKDEALYDKGWAQLEQLRQLERNLRRSR